MSFPHGAGLYAETDSREAGTMRRLIFGMNVTLDGYIAAPGDDIGWGGPPSEQLGGITDRPTYGTPCWKR